MGHAAGNKTISQNGFRPTRTAATAVNAATERNMATQTSEMAVRTKITESANGRNHRPKERPYRRKMGTINVDNRTKSDRRRTKTRTIRLIRAFLLPCGRTSSRTGTTATVSTHTSYIWDIRSVVENPRKFGGASARRLGEPRYGRAGNLRIPNACVRYSKKYSLYYSAACLYNSISYLSLSYRPFPTMKSAARSQFG